MFSLSVLNHTILYFPYPQSFSHQLASTDIVERNDFENKLVIQSLQDRPISTFCLAKELGFSYYIAGWHKISVTFFQYKEMNPL